ncbi:MAG: hypothetical protein IJ085_01965 [Turicibacter sp.]|nr:hypothetical protein [Turicibacter sp.]
MSQGIYKRLTVIFYEKDKECYEAFKKLSEEREESMTKIARKLISAELEKNKKGE